MLRYIAWNVAEKDAAVLLSHQPAGNTVWSRDNSFTVGLNWQIFHPSGNRVIFQYGTVPGFNSACILYPELRLGIVLLTKEEDRGRSASLSPLVERIMKAIDPRTAAPP